MDTGVGLLRVRDLHAAVPVHLDSSCIFQMITGRVSLALLFRLPHRLEPDTWQSEGRGFESRQVHFFSRTDNSRWEMVPSGSDTRLVDDQKSAPHRRRSSQRLMCLLRLRASVGSISTTRQAYRRALDSGLSSPPPASASRHHSAICVCPAVSPASRPGSLLPVCNLSPPPLL
jgi:hypothetical protein